MSIDVTPEGSSTSGQPGWTNIADVDFSAMASVAIANGANVLDGKSWWGENAANAAAFSIVNGSGLTMRSSTAVATNYWSGLRTAPILTIPLTTLCSLNWTQVTDIRVLAMITFTNGLTTEEGFNLALEAYSQEAGFAQAFSSVSRIRIGASDSIRIMNGAASFIDATSARATDDTLILQTRGGPPFNYRAFTSQSLAGEFVFTDWRHWGDVPIMNSSVVNAIKTPESLALTFAIRNGGITGHASPLTAVIRRVRIDYF